MSSLEPRFVEANGLRFAYIEDAPAAAAGDRKRPKCVVMVHGFPDTAHTWDQVRPTIAALGFRVVTPVTRGYAPTEIPREEDFGVETLARDLLALLDALGEEEAILVGHDWGASACLSAATLAPARVRLLAMVAIPHPASITPTPSLAWTVRHFFTLSRRGAAARIRAGDMAHIDELVKRWSPAWDVPPGETDAVKAAFRQPGCLEAALGYYRGITLRLPRSQRTRVKVPAVGFAGTDDIIHPDAYEKARSWYANGYEVVRMPGGHFMHREHPERFATELARVLEPYR